MDMTLRSFVFAGAVLVVLAAGLAGWWVFDRFAPADGDPRTAADTSDRVIVSDRYDDREGSLFDEFGADETGGRITVNSGAGETRSIFDAPSDRGGGGFRFGDAPRFDWSGSGALGRSDEGDLPRDTAADRVESDCRVRGGGSYACRCLVRLARQTLSEAEFAFLSLAQEPEPRRERLEQAGVALSGLGEVSARLIALDAAAQRRCGAGLAR